MLEELEIIQTILWSQKKIMDEVVAFLNKANDQSGKLRDFVDYYEDFTKLNVTLAEINKLADAAKRNQANVNAHRPGPE